jgi:hypothetical protein
VKDQKMKYMKVFNTFCKVFGDMDAWYKVESKAVFTPGIGRTITLTAREFGDMIGKKTTTGHRWMAAFLEAGLLTIHGDYKATDKRTYVVQDVVAWSEKIPEDFTCSFHEIFKPLKKGKKEFKNAS